MSRIAATVGSLVPPSALPGNSPSKGEIDLGWTARTYTTLVTAVPDMFPTLCAWMGFSGGHDAISPLEGEMPGRAEGGNPRHNLRTAK